MFPVKSLQKLPTGSLILHMSIFWNIFVNVGSYGSENFKWLLLQQCDSFSTKLSYMFSDSPHKSYLEKVWNFKSQFYKRLKFSFTKGPMGWELQNPTSPTVMKPFQPNIVFMTVLAKVTYWHFEISCLHLKYFFFLKHDSILVTTSKTLLPQLWIFFNQTVSVCMFTLTVRTNIDMFGISNLNNKKDSTLTLWLMESRRPMKPGCLTDLMQMGVIGVNAFMGVCSLLMAHNRRQAGRQLRSMDLLFLLISFVPSVMH